MNFAHIHLLLNHLPVMGFAFGTLLLVLAVVKKSDELKKVSLGVFVVVGALSVPAYFTGEPAEKVVQNLPGVARALIDRHEEAATLSLVAAEMLGLFSLGVLLYFRAPKTLPAWSTLSALVFSLVISGLMAHTANLGGQVRHSEIRSSVVRGPSPNEVTLNRYPGAAR